MKQIAKLKDDARRYELKEEWENAIDAYLEVLRLSEDELDLPLYNRVGDLFVRLGRPMEAVQYYEQAADRYADAGLYNNAIALCNKALRYEPGRLPLLRKLGAFSASQGFFTDARRWYLEFTEKSLKRGAMDEAFSALSELAGVSDDPEIRELLARQLQEHGRHEAAIQEFKRLHSNLAAAGQHARADAIAAELKQLDPNVNIEDVSAADPEPEAQDWYYLEELPGFVDAEPAPPAAAVPVADPVDDEFDIQEEFESGPQPEPSPEREAEVDPSDVIAAESVEDFAAEMLDPEPMAETETTEYFDLPELTFDDYDKAAASTAEPIEDIVHEEPLDFGPVEVEVEERHQLLDISGLRIQPEDLPQRTEPLDAFARFEDFGVDADEPAESNEPLPMLDADAPGEESGSITSIDDSEFGDYTTDPEPRVFDFEDDESDPVAAPESELESDPLFDTDAFEWEPAFQEQASSDNDLSFESEEPAFEAELPVEPEASFDVEERVAEPEQPAFENDAATFEDEVPSFEVEPPSSEVETPSFEVETPSFEVETPSFEVEAPSFEVEIPSFEVEPEQPFELSAQAYEDETVSDEGLGTDLYADEQPFAAFPLEQLPPPPPLPPPANSGNKRPSFEYVDLAALLDEPTGDEQAEDSTRFVVAEMPPTGDEEKDFADMLLQFKQKVAQSIPKDDAGSHYDLGIAFKEMGLVDEAIGEFQIALRSGNDRLKVYEELGSCFLMKQQYSIAITVLNRAQQMPHSDDTELLGVYYNLGRAHEELGQKAEARAAFERVVAVDIGFQDTTKRLARL